KQIVMLALQVSILSIVFALGLKATLGDLLYLTRRPGLLVRSLLSVFVVMPILAVVLAQLFNFSQTVRVVLVALAVSPLPPILPKKEARSGGYTPFGLGLLAILAIVSIVAVPGSLWLIGRLFDRPFSGSPWAIARAVSMSTLVPLAAGVVVRSVFPALAGRLEKFVTL